MPKHHDIPWVHLVWETHYSNGKLPSHVKKGSFWWRDILKLLDTYKGIASVSLNNGRTCMLWSDLWNGIVPSQSYLELWSFAKKKSISIQHVKRVEDLEAIFHLPLSMIAYDQLQLLLPEIEQCANSDDHDVWSYIWNNHIFTSARAYKQLCGHAVVHPVFSGYGKHQSNINIRFSFGFY